MKVRDFRHLFNNLPDDFEVEFLCPDGWADDFDKFRVKEAEKLVEFLSYCARGDFQKVEAAPEQST